MPTESPSTPVRSGGTGSAALPAPAALKCSVCGAASLGPTDGVVILGEQMERICGQCVRENRDDDGVTLSILRPRLGNDVVDRIRGERQSSSPPSPVDPVVLDLSRLRGASNVAALRSARRRASGATSPAHSASSSVSSATPVDCSESYPTPSSLASPNPATPSVVIPVPRGAGEAQRSDDPSRPMPAPPELQSKSLPTTKASPWATLPRVVPSGLGKCPIPMPDKTPTVERPSNPLLDVTTAPVRSASRGCLYPGSIFTGSQRSGRNAYDVTITIADCHIDQSTLCGYLTIKDLTETHPELTTFFDAEIIGPKYGFITGTRYGASKHDDLRHWERFEQFHRTAVRQDIIRPEMFLRDPIPEPNCRPRERDHLFLRIKEKFLVPDHSVRDINGASFAGFYYAILDFAPALEIEDPVPGSPLTPRSPLIGMARRMSSTTPRPDTPRRQSTSGPRPETNRRASMSSSPRPDAPRRQSSSRAPPEPKVATLRGFYFHSLNQEPFQELSLVHQPSTRAGAFQLR